MAAQRRDLLVRELNHHVKNMLAIVQALAAQTAAGAGGKPDRFVQDFARRPRTLAQAHGLMTGSDWEGAEMGTLVEAVLAAWRCTGRIVVPAPQYFRISAHQAQAWCSPCTNSPPMRQVWCPAVGERAGGGHVAEPGLHRRIILRLEKHEAGIGGKPPSLDKLAADSRQRGRLEERPYTLARTPGRVLPEPALVALR
ncbi:HWE histidine kinase domain-containing protein [Pseudoroseomonas wenyumeiae]